MLKISRILRVRKTGAVWARNSVPQMILTMRFCRQRILFKLEIYSEQVRAKLIKANKCLFVLRSLRKEGFSQGEVDHLFSALVLLNFTYGLFMAQQTEISRSYKTFWIDAFKGVDVLCYEEKTATLYFITYCVSDVITFSVENYYNSRYYYILHYCYILCQLLHFVAKQAFEKCFIVSCNHWPLGFDEIWFSTDFQACFFDDNTRD